MSKQLLFRSSSITARANKIFRSLAGCIRKIIHLFQVERHEVVNVVQAAESPGLPEIGFGSIRKNFTKLRKF